LKKRPDERVRLINQNPHLSSRWRLDAIFYGCDIAGEFFRKILMLSRDTAGSDG